MGKLRSFKLFLMTYIYQLTPVNGAPVFGNSGMAGRIAVEFGVWLETN